MLSLYLHCIKFLDALSYGSHCPSCITIYGKPSLEILCHAWHPMYNLAINMANLFASVLEFVKNTTWMKYIINKDKRFIVSNHHFHEPLSLINIHFFISLNSTCLLNIQKEISLPATLSDSIIYMIW